MRIRSRNELNFDEYVAIVHRCSDQETVQVVVNTLQQDSEGESNEENEEPVKERVFY